MPHHFESICNNAAKSTNWLVGNSQMANFSGAFGYYQIMYKRGGKIDELMATMLKLYLWPLWYVSIDFSTDSYHLGIF